MMLPVHNASIPGNATKQRNVPGCPHQTVFIAIAIGIAIGIAIAIGIGIGIGIVSFGSCPCAVFATALHGIR